MGHRETGETQGLVRFGLFAVVILLASVWSVSRGQAAGGEYEIKTAIVHSSDNRAGAHPDLTMGIELHSASAGVPLPTMDLFFALPPGLLANVRAVTRCNSAELLSTDVEKVSGGGCPQDSQVGIMELEAIQDGSVISVFEPIYQMTAPGGHSASRLGFVADAYPVFVDARLRESDYGLTLAIEGAPSAASLVSAMVTIWGVPADASHDGYRITPYEAVHNEGTPETPTGRRSSGLTPVPFLVNSVKCGEERGVSVTARSYAEPTRPVNARALLPPVTGCESLDFSPETTSAVFGREADSASGLEMGISLPQEGIARPGLPAEAALRSIQVELPSGFAINPSAATGLSACEESDIGLLSVDPVDVEPSPPSCPESSRIGTVEIETPLLDRSLNGSLYLATPDRNPFEALLAVYLLAEGQGVRLKLPVRFGLDPDSGAITAEVDEIPQLPFTELSLRFKDGPRGLLRLPEACDTYVSHVELISWSHLRRVNESSEFNVDSGCYSGFKPGFSVRSLNLAAGGTTRLLFELTREDREENPAAVSITLPSGLSARVAGLPICPDFLAVQDNCPQASRIGSVRVAAGAGPFPSWIPEAGTTSAAAYLGGPYGGAPFSLVLAVPMRVGPFDLGAAVLSAGISIDPHTAQATIRVNTLPQIVAGVPIDYRAIHLLIDRPGFVVNPTGCDQKTVNGVVASARNAQTSVAARFQIGNCRRLEFAPKLALRLSGATGRNGHPKATVVLRSSAEEANIRSAMIMMPRGEYLDQSHIRGVCSRRDFSIENCRSNSVYGRVRVSTPLLAQPLQGNVYLRESDGRLPDLAIDLHGEVHMVLIGRLSTPNARIRVSFDDLPDVPFSRLKLTTAGRKRGFLVNSEALCDRRKRASILLVGHNGEVRYVRSRMRVRCG